MPIDHFRLLGVSPSAQAEAVLRAFQLRLDRAPEQGFTDEVLLQRSELLRLSADLLTDDVQRQDYEAALLAGSSGLELSSNREVAGLILLWEAHAPIEAFNLAKKALQPPQAPALGSGREADLTLVAALSCQAAAAQEQEQRHYQSASLLLTEGIQLLQRMGKLPDHRESLEKELEALIPYRILDLVSRDVTDSELHHDGVQLLDEFVRKRGGIEGKNVTQAFGGLEQSDFVLFFQQIRKFLTVQEQLDLFLKWQRRGSAEAGFLGVIALVAAGFSQRKPERLLQARKNLKGLELSELDKYPLLGSIDLLLADVKRAEDRFLSSSDEGLKSWLGNYPGESLAALCDYCRDWLRRDVLPGYRDIDIEPVDLEAWFADRDVQSYVENLDRKGGLGFAKSGFSFLSSFSSEKQPSDLYEEDLEPETDFPIPGGVTDSSQEDSDFAAEQEEQWDESSSSFSVSNVFLKLLDLKKPLQRLPFLLGPIAVVILVGLVASLGWFGLRTNPSIETKTTKSRLLDDSEPVFPQLDSEVLEPKTIEIEPLTIEKPGKEEVQMLLDAWLSGKAALLSGGESNILPIVAREALLKRVQEERKKDIDQKETQIIDSVITSLKVVSQTPKRIEVKVKLSYSDKRVKSSGEIVSETSIPSFKVTYILGREKDVWQLVDYISGK